MRRRYEPRVRSSGGQVGSQGVRKARLASRRAAHSAWSDICGARSTTPSPTIAGSCSDKVTVRKNAMNDRLADTTEDGTTEQPRAWTAELRRLSSVVRYQAALRARLSAIVAA